MNKEQWLDTCRVEFFAAAEIGDERADRAFDVVSSAIERGESWDSQQEALQDALRAVAKDLGLEPVIEWLRSATMTDDVSKSIRF